MHAEVLGALTSPEGRRAIDAAEIALGESRGRARTTLHDRDALLESARWSERD